VETSNDTREALESRAARNQSVCRSLNNAIAARHLDSAFGEYLCECTVENCLGSVSLTAVEYAEVRRHESRFIVLRGHWSPVAERLVSETDHRYQVVENLGHAARLAATLDRRSSDALMSMASARAPTQCVPCPEETSPSVGAHQQTEGGLGPGWGQAEARRAP